MCFIELRIQLREHGKMGIVVEVLQQVIPKVNVHLQEKNHIFMNKHPFAPSVPKISKIG